MTTAYVGRRHQGALVVIRLPEGTELTPERSLDLVKHSPSGFEVGYRGSGPAQLACGLLLDYYNDTQVAREHYIAFRNRVISQLECDGPAACWHLSGEELDAAMATITDDIVAPPPDGGQPSQTFQRTGEQSLAPIGGSSSALIATTTSYLMRASTSGSSFYVVKGTAPTRHP